MATYEVGTGLYLGGNLIGQSYLGEERVVYAPYSFTDTPTGYISASAVMILDAYYYGGSGNTWSDRSGNGNNADVSLITSYYNVGGGGCFDFPGTDYTKIATVTQSGSLNNAFAGDFTMDMWLTIDATGTGFSDTAAPWSKDDWFDNPSPGLLFAVGTGDSNLGRQNFYTNGSSNFSATSGKVLDPFTTTQWFNLQYVRSGSVITAYSNNTLIQTITGKTENMTNSNNFIIGRGRNDATANYKWNGKIAVISVYNTALTTAQLQQNNTALKGRYGY